MSKIMDKAFGSSRPAPQVEGEVIEAEAKMSPQEKMMMLAIKAIAPGIDFGAISKLGADTQEFVGRVGVTLGEHSAALARIEANQAAILAHLAELRDAFIGKDV